MSRKTIVRLFSWVPLLVTLLSLLGLVALAGAGCAVEEPMVFVALLAAGGGFALLSLLIVRNQPENRIGWLAAVSGLLFPLMPVTLVFAGCSVPAISQSPAAPYAVWIAYVAALPAVAALFFGLPFLFPNGRFLSPTWRGIGLVSLSIFALVAFLVATLPGPMLYNGLDSTYDVENPFGLAFLPKKAGPFIDDATKFLMIAITMIGVFSFVQRWRRASVDTRQQLKWFAYFLATAVTFQMAVEFYGGFVDETIFTALNGWFYGLVLIMVFSGFPTVVGIAVFKYRLYDIDVIIRRTLVYAVLTAFLALVYFGTVVFLQSVIGRATNEQSPLVIVLSTLLIAALFSPLRRRIQTFIDRRFYRRKYDAALTLAQFAQTARDEVDMERLSAALINVVEKALQPEQTSLWLKKNKGSK